MLNTDNNLYDIYLIYVEKYFGKIQGFFSAIICKINNELPNGNLTTTFLNCLP
jgi:hypothetical protein